MICCFARRMRLAMCSRMCSRIDVSVAALEYRAFVFAAPPYFVAGNPPAKYRGAVSVGAVSRARGNASPILTVASKGVS
jgi:hypothetical protein